LLKTKYNFNENILKVKIRVLAVGIIIGASRARQPVNISTK